jgi:hypothetical protein
MCVVSKMALRCAITMEINYGIKISLSTLLLIVKVTKTTAHQKLTVTRNQEISQKTGMFGTISCNFVVDQVNVDFEENVWIVFLHTQRH